MAATRRIFKITNKFINFRPLDTAFVRIKESLGAYNGNVNEYVNQQYHFYSGTKARDKLY